MAFDLLNDEAWNKVVQREDFKQWPTDIKIAFARNYFKSAYEANPDFIARKPAERTVIKKNFFSKLQIEQPWHEKHDIAGPLYSMMRNSPQAILEAGQSLSEGMMLPQAAKKFGEATGLDKISVTPGITGVSPVPARNELMTPIIPEVDERGVPRSYDESGKNYHKYESIRTNVKTNKAMGFRREDNGGLSLFDNLNHWNNISFDQRAVIINEYKKKYGVEGKVVPIEYETRDQSFADKAIQFLGVGVVLAGMGLPIGAVAGLPVLARLGRFAPPIARMISWGAGGAAFERVRAYLNDQPKLTTREDYEAFRNYALFEAALSTTLWGKRLFDAARIIAKIESKTVGQVIKERLREVKAGGMPYDITANFQGTKARAMIYETDRRNIIDEQMSQPQNVLNKQLEVYQQWVESTERYARNIEGERDLGGIKTGQRAEAAATDNRVLFSDSKEFQEAVQANRSATARTEAVIKEVATVVNPTRGAAFAQRLKNVNDGIPIITNEMAGRPPSKELQAIVPPPEQPGLSIGAMGESAAGVADTVAFLRTVENNSRQMVGSTKTLSGVFASEGIDTAMMTSEAVTRRSLKEGVAAFIERLRTGKVPPREATPQAAAPEAPVASVGPASTVPPVKKNLSSMSRKQAHEEWDNILGITAKTMKGIEYLKSRFTLNDEVVNKYAHSLVFSIARWRRAGNPITSLTQTGVEILQKRILFAAQDANRAISDKFHQATGRAMDPPHLTPDEHFAIMFSKGEELNQRMDWILKRRIAMHKAGVLDATLNEAATIKQRTALSGSMKGVREETAIAGSEGRQNVKSEAMSIPMEEVYQAKAAQGQIIKEATGQKVEYVPFKKTPDAIQVQPTGGVGKQTIRQEALSTSIRFNENGVETWYTSYGDPIAYKPRYAVYAKDANGKVYFAVTEEANIAKQMNEFVNSLGGKVATGKKIGKGKAVAKPPENVVATKDTEILATEANKILKKDLSPEEASSLFNNGNIFGAALLPFSVEDEGNDRLMLSVLGAAGILATRGRHHSKLWKNKYKLPPYSNVRRLWQKVSSPEVTLMGKKFAPKWERIRTPRLIIRNIPASKPTHTIPVMKLRALQLINSVNKVRHEIAVARQAHVRQVTNTMIGERLMKDGLPKEKAIEILKSYDRALDYLAPTRRPPVPNTFTRVGPDLYVGKHGAGGEKFGVFKIDEGAGTFTVQRAGFETREEALLAAKKQYVDKRVADTQYVAKTMAEHQTAAEEKLKSILKDVDGDGVIASAGNDIYGDIVTVKGQPIYRVFNKGELSSVHYTMDGAERKIDNLVTDIEKQRTYHRQIVREFQQQYGANILERAAPLSSVGTSLTKRPISKMNPAELHKEAMNLEQWQLRMESNEIAQAELFANGKVPVEVVEMMEAERTAFNARNKAVQQRLSQLQDYNAIRKSFEQAKTSQNFLKENLPPVEPGELKVGYTFVTGEYGMVITGATTKGGGIVEVQKTSGVNKGQTFKQDVPKTNWFKVEWFGPNGVNKGVMSEQQVNQLRDYLAGGERNFVTREPGIQEAIEIAGTKYVQSASQTNFFPEKRKVTDVDFLNLINKKGSVKPYGTANLNKAVSEDIPAGRPMVAYEARGEYEFAVLSVHPTNKWVNLAYRLRRLGARNEADSAYVGLTKVPPAEAADILNSLRDLNVLNKVKNLPEHELALEKSIDDIFKTEEGMLAKEFKEGSEAVERDFIDEAIDSTTTKLFGPNARLEMFRQNMLGSLNGIVAGIRVDENGRFYMDTDAAWMGMALGAAGRGVTNPRAKAFLNMKGVKARLALFGGRATLNKNAAGISRESMDTIEALNVHDAKVHSKIHPPLKTRLGILYDKFNVAFGDRNYMARHPIEKEVQAQVKRAKAGKGDARSVTGLASPEEQTWNEMVAREHSSAVAERFFRDADERVWGGMDVNPNYREAINKIVAYRTRKGIVEHPSGDSSRTEFIPGASYFDFKRLIESGDFAKSLGLSKGEWQLCWSRATEYFKYTDELLTYGQQNKLYSPEFVQRVRGREYSPTMYVEFADEFTELNEIAGRLLEGRAGSVNADGVFMLKGHKPTGLTYDTDVRAGLMQYTNDLTYLVAQNKAMFQLADATAKGGFTGLARVPKIVGQQPGMKGTINLSGGRNYGPDTVNGVTVKTQPIYEKLERNEVAHFYMVDGRATPLYLRKDFSVGWNQVDPVMQASYSTALQWASGQMMVKALATGYNPFFFLANLPLDIMNVLTSEQYGNIRGMKTRLLPVGMMQMTKDLALTFRDAWGFSGKRLFSDKVSDRVRDFVDSGAASNLLTSYGRVGRQQQFAAKAFENAGDVVAYTGARSEIHVRLAHAMRTEKNSIALFIKKNQREPNAAELAIIKKDANIRGCVGSLDFNQGGVASKWIDKWIPYFNVGPLAIRNAAYNYRQDPLGFMAKIAQFMVMSAGLHAYNASMPGYDQIDPETKANNFIIMYPNVIPGVTHWTDSNGIKHYNHMAIRKDGIYQPFISFFDYVFDKVVTKKTPDPIHMKELAEAFKRAVPIPNPLESPVIKAVLAAGGFDVRRWEYAYRGRQQVEPELMANKDNGKTIQMLSNAVGLPPANVSLALQSIFPSSNVLTHIPNHIGGLITGELAEDIAKEGPLQWFMDSGAVKRVIKTTNPYTGLYQKVGDLTAKANSENERTNREFDSLMDAYDRSEEKGTLPEKTSSLANIKTFFAGLDEKEMERIEKRYNLRRSLKSVQGENLPVFKAILYIPNEAKADIILDHISNMTQEEKQKFYNEGLKVSSSTKDKNGIWSDELLAIIKRKMAEQKEQVFQEKLKKVSNK